MAADPSRFSRRRFSLAVKLLIEVIGLEESRAVREGWESNEGNSPALGVKHPGECINRHRFSELLQESMSLRVFGDWRRLGSEEMRN